MLKASTRISSLCLYLSNWFYNWRKVLLLFTPPLSLLLFASIFSTPITIINPILSYDRILGVIESQKSIVENVKVFNVSAGTRNSNLVSGAERKKKKDELLQSRIAVCLVGGARRFELTGPTLLEMIFKEYPNSDLFLHSPHDHNSFKFSLLKAAPRIAAVRIFEPTPVPETESHARVLTAMNSPNGIQGLLQYFNLVEGCLKMIKAHQDKKGFKYNWIVRTRVDGYWNAPLAPENFVPGQYIVPPGSSYGGLNDRFGIGDLNASTVALSRISLIPQLDCAGYNHLNSEAAFKAQLVTQGVSYRTNALPFCIVSDRKYDFPPGRYGVPVAAMSSAGPLSGAKCRPCTPVCKDQCVEDVMQSLDKGWSWTECRKGTLELCDAHGSWEQGWEKIFDRVAGKKSADARKRVRAIRLEHCVEQFKEMKKRASSWHAPPAEVICGLGLGRT